MNPKDYSQMMAYLVRPGKAKGGRIEFGQGGKGKGKEPKFVWEKLTKDPLFEQFWKEQIDIANNPSISPKEYERSKSLFIDLKKVIDKYELTDPEQIFKNFQKETRDTESIKRFPNLEKNKGRTPLLSSRSHLDNLLGPGKKFDRVYKTDVSPTGQKLLTIDEFAKKIGYSSKQIRKLLAGRFLDMPKPVERFTLRGVEAASLIQGYNKFQKALEDSGIKVTYPKDMERIKREGSRGATGKMKRGAGKIRIEASPEQIKNFKLPFVKKDVFSGDITPTKQKDIYSSLSKASDEYKKFGYSKDRKAVTNFKKALNNTLRAMSTDELVKFINKNPKLKHIVETTFNPKTLEFEKISTEDLAKAGVLDNFKKQGFFEVDHIRGRSTVKFDSATKKITDGLNLEYPKNLTIIPKGLNLSTKQIVENFVADNPNSPAIKKIDKYFKDAEITYYDRVNNMYRGADPKLGATGVSHLGLENDIEKILLNKKTFIGQDGREKVIIDSGERLLADLKELSKIRKEKIDLSNIRPGEKGSIDKQLLIDITKGLGKAGTFAFDKAIRPLGTRAAGSLFAADQIRSNIQKGENIADAVVDPLVGLELSFPGLFKENVAKITKNPILQRALNLGRFARFTTPVGAALGVAGLGVDYGKFVKRELERKAADPEAYRAEQEEQMGVSAAEGGLIGDKSGPPPERGPNPQGLPSLLKRVRNL